MLFIVSSSFVGVYMTVRFSFFKQKTAYDFASCLVGSEMCIRDRSRSAAHWQYTGTGNCVPYSATSAR
mgnify:CR=1 FL=1